MCRIWHLSACYLVLTDYFLAEIIANEGHTYIVAS